MKKITKYGIGCSVGLLIFPVAMIILIFVDHIFETGYDRRNYNGLIKQVVADPSWSVVNDRLMKTHYQILPLERWGGYYDKKIIEKLAENQERVYVCSWTTWWPMTGDFSIFGNDGPLWLFVLVSGDGKIKNYSPELSKLTDQTQVP